MNQWLNAHFDPNLFFCPLSYEPMMKGEIGGGNTPNSTWTRMQRLQFLIISMTMKGKNKQTLISHRTFAWGARNKAGLHHGTLLLIVVNSRLHRSDDPQLDFSSLSLCLLCQTIQQHKWQTSRRQFSPNSMGGAAEKKFFSAKEHLY